MYIILVYDFGQKRVGKMLKLCRRYLNWIQNSVFEGEMTEVQLKEMLHEAKRIMNEEQDSLILFKNRDQKWMDKQIVGIERQSTDDFL
ncbi:CRISPR-associated endonuclease Cas2 [Siphonobacter curvatus]|uniref:CRISPR-associated endoribonuclease Cas2 n=1 Tax=Siphonobacter curvatus TaxID=2094562 RepID=A0A2S7IH67_9BACT|nr:CRISPR-associated endonuclease Cas2 [Siphonobacter curvatus]PQA55036.1 CRISPR-associated endonuclease Cas2 [Siphonobacter curvatus]